jgi:hypothetical protein
MQTIKTISNMFLIVASIVFLPIQFIGDIAGIVSLVWLILLGKWSAIVIGILFTSFMPLALSLMTMPTIPLALASVRLRESNHLFFFTILSFLIALFVNTCLGIWTYYTFLLVAKPLLLNHPVPALGWSFLALSMPVSSLFQKNEVTDSPIFTSIITTACFLGLSIMFMNNSFNLGYYACIILIVSFFQSLNIISKSNEDQEEIYS